MGFYKSKSIIIIILLLPIPVFYYMRIGNSICRVICIYSALCFYLLLLFLLQMDYIAGSFYDGFLLYAMALEETLAEGGAQNDGISITMKTQNRHIWGKKIVVTYLNLKRTKTSRFY